MSPFSEVREANSMSNSANSSKRASGRTSLTEGRVRGGVLEEVLMVMVGGVEWVVCCGYCGVRVVGLVGLRHGKSPGSCGIDGLE